MLNLIYYSHFNIYNNNEILVFKIIITVCDYFHVLQSLLFIKMNLIQSKSQKLSQFLENYNVYSLVRDS